MTYLTRTAVKGLAAVALLGAMLSGPVGASTKTPASCNLSILVSGLTSVNTLDGSGLPANRYVTTWISAPDAGALDTPLVSPTGTINEVSYSSYYDGFLGQTVTFTAQIWKSQTGRFTGGLLATCSATVTF